MLPKRAIAGAILLASIGASCGTRGSRADGALDDAAHEYVRLALALGERDPDSLDIYWGPSEWRDAARKAYRPLGEIRADAQRLRAQLAPDERAAGADDRRAFLDAQVGALIARIDVLRGTRLPFDEESRQLFGIVPPHADDAAAAAIRRQLDALLPGGGDLARRFAALEARFVVAPERVGGVFSAALAACRAETAAHLTLPSDERVHVDVQPSRSPWAAFTQYLGDHRSRITVNGAFMFTVDRLLQLACHEGYPGHHTAYTLQDDELVRRRHRIEFFIEPMFSPQALAAEGAATYAPDLVFDVDARIEANRRLLSRAAISSAGSNNDDAAAVATYVRASQLVDDLRLTELAIAARYLDGTLEFARAAAAFTDDAVMADPMPVLKFLNEFRTYVVTYTAGRDRVARTAGRNGDGDARWQAYRRLLVPGP